MTSALWLLHPQQHSMVFCKVRAPLLRLKKEAFRLEYLMPTDPDKLRDLCERGRPGFWEPLQIPEPMSTSALIMGGSGAEGIYQLFIISGMSVTDTSRLRLIIR